MPDSDNFIIASTSSSFLTLHALSSNVGRVTTFWYPINDAVIYNHSGVMWLTNHSPLMPCDNIFENVFTWKELSDNMSERKANWAGGRNRNVSFSDVFRFSFDELTRTKHWRGLKSLLICQKQARIWSFSKCFRYDMDIEFFENSSSPHVSLVEVSSARNLFRPLLLPILLISSYFEPISMQIKALTFRDLIH